MNKYEKAIAEIPDEALKRVLKDTEETMDKYALQIQIGEVSGLGDINLHKKRYALMHILNDFTNRELKERAKKKK